MPSLSDRSSNPGSWSKMVLVAIGLGIVAGLVVASWWAYDRYVETPRLLSRRFDEPPGVVGLSSGRVSHLGAAAVPTLVQDLGDSDARRRVKALELLAAMRAPGVQGQVLDGLGKGLQDSDIGVRMAAVLGLAQQRTEAAAAKLWPQLATNDEIVRTRAMVALGLVGGRTDAERLLREVMPKTRGLDRYLVAWAAGRIGRRLSREPPLTDNELTARKLETNEDIVAHKADLNKVLDAIDLGEDPSRQAARLAELTDVGFTGWNLSHQINLQVLMVSGLDAVMGVGDSSDMAPVKQGLQLPSRRPGPDAQP